MKTIIVTGSFGLVGSDISIHLTHLGFRIVGVDCDIRSKLFEGVKPLDDSAKRILLPCPNIEVHNIDIRDLDSLHSLFDKLSKTDEIHGVIHTAAQPSHDWAAYHPFVDFDINARGTLNLLEVTRKFAPNALFIHLSTNKVYGDLPNMLDLSEYEYRYDLDSSDLYYDGIDENMSIDACKHSLFGVSKASADLYVQEYARYFNMKTVVLRGGCLTGAKHRGHKLHGFLNYLVKCSLSGTSYTVFGYHGKQVRDNLDARDISRLIAIMFEPANLANHTKGDGRIFNMGGGRSNSISILEAFRLLKERYNISTKYTVVDANRSGDHIWYITNTSKLKRFYDWSPIISIDTIFDDLIANVYV